jgi:hypothetical protein
MVDALLYLLSCEILPPNTWFSVVGFLGHCVGEVKEIALMMSMQDYDVANNRLSKLISDILESKLDLTHLGNAFNGLWKEVQSFEVLCTKTPLSEVELETAITINYMKLAVMCGNSDATENMKELFGMLHETRTRMAKWLDREWYKVCEDDVSEPFFKGLMCGMNKYRDAYAIHNPEKESVRMFKLSNALNQIDNDDFLDSLLINGDESLTTYQVSQRLSENLWELVEQLCDQFR